MNRFIFLVFLVCYITLAGCNQVFRKAEKALKYPWVGLHPVNAQKRPTENIGRTFVGVRQQTPLTNGGPVYIYILVAAALQQSQAYNFLQDFGCDASEIIMFDGSGSTQMNSVTSGVSLSSSNGRTVPLWLAVKLD